MEGSVAPQTDAWLTAAAIEAASSSTGFDHPLIEAWLEQLALRPELHCQHTASPKDRQLERHEAMLAVGHAINDARSPTGIKPIGAPCDSAGELATSPIDRDPHGAEARTVPLLGPTA